MNDIHKKFEAKCFSDLLERRGKDGEYTSTFNARQFYDSRLIDALENDLFRENSDYKALYQSKCNNYNRLVERCEDMTREAKQQAVFILILQGTIEILRNSIIKKKKNELSNLQN